MPTVTDSPSSELVLKQLRRVERSQTFSTVRRQRKVLRFLVTEMLALRGNTLTGEVIAQMFYDSNNDAMRAELGRLRERLGRYHRDEGKDDKILIEIPKPGYLSEVSWRDDQVSQEGPDSTVSSSLAAAEQPTDLRAMVYTCLMDSGQAVEEKRFEVLTLL